MKHRIVVGLFLVALTIGAGTSWAESPWSADTTWDMAPYMNITDLYNHRPGGIMWHWSRMDSILTAGLSFGGSVSTDTSSTQVLRWGVYPTLRQLDSLALLKLPILADLFTNLQATDSLLGVVDDKLDAIALYDSTNAAAPSKFFASGWDTITAVHTITARLNPNGTAYSANYRMRELTVSVLGDSISVTIIGPWTTTAQTTRLYPGESFTWTGIEADSAVVTDVFGGGADVRWWVRGR